MRHQPNNGNTADVSQKELSSDSCSHGSLVQSSETLARAESLWTWPTHPSSYFFFFILFAKLFSDGMSLLLEEDGATFSKSN